MHLGVDFSKNNSILISFIPSGEVCSNLSFYDFKITARLKSDIEGMPVIDTSDNYEENTETISLEQIEEANLGSIKLGNKTYSTKDLLAVFWVAILNNISHYNGTIKNVLFTTRNQTSEHINQLYCRTAESLGIRSIIHSLQQVKNDIGIEETDDRYISRALAVQACMNWNKQEDEKRRQLKENIWIRIKGEDEKSLIFKNKYLYPVLVEGEDKFIEKETKLNLSIHQDKVLWQIYKGRNNSNNPRIKLIGEIWFPLSNEIYNNELTLKVKYINDEDIQFSLMDTIIAIVNYKGNDTSVINYKKTSMEEKYDYIEKKLNRLKNRLYNFGNKGFLDSNENIKGLYEKLLQETERNDLIGIDIILEKLEKEVKEYINL